MSKHFLCELKSCSERECCIKGGAKGETEAATLATHRARHAAARPTEHFAKNEALGTHAVVEAGAARKNVAGNLDTAENLAGQKTAATQAATTNAEVAYEGSTKEAAENKAKAAHAVREATAAHKHVARTKQAANDNNNIKSDGEKLAGKKTPTSPQAATAKRAVADEGPAKQSAKDKTIAAQAVQEAAAPRNNVAGDLDTAENLAGKKTTSTQAATADREAADEGSTKQSAKNKANAANFVRESVARHKNVASTKHAANDNNVIKSDAEKLVGKKTTTSTQVDAAKRAVADEGATKQSGKGKATAGQAVREATAAGALDAAENLAGKKRSITVAVTINRDVADEGSTKQSAENKGIAAHGVPEATAAHKNVASTEQAANDNNVIKSDGEKLVGKKTTTSKQAATAKRAVADEGPAKQSAKDKTTAAQAVREAAATHKNAAGTEQAPNENNVIKLDADNIAGKKGITRQAATVKRAVADRGVSKQSARDKATAAKDVQEALPARRNVAGDLDTAENLAGKKTTSTQAA